MNTSWPVSPFVCFLYFVETVVQEIKLIEEHEELTIPVEEPEKVPTIYIYLFSSWLARRKQINNYDQILLILRFDC